MATNLFILFWPSSKPLPSKTPATTSSKNSHRYQRRLIPYPLEAVRTLTKRLRKRRKSIDVGINIGTRVKKILALLLLPMLTVGLEKICPRSYASTITKKGTTRGTALSLEKIYQKTSISLSDLCPND